MMRQMEEMKKQLAQATMKAEMAQQKSQEQERITKALQRKLQVKDGDGNEAFLDPEEDIESVNDRVEDNAETIQILKERVQTLEERVDAQDYKIEDRDTTFKNESPRKAATIEQKQALFGKKYKG